jgi:hypothetical protein
MEFDDLIFREDGDLLVAEAHLSSGTTGQMLPDLEEKLYSFFDVLVPQKFGSVSVWETVYVAVSDPCLLPIWASVLNRLKEPVVSHRTRVREELGSPRYHIRIEVIGTLTAPRYTETRVVSSVPPSDQQ